MTIQLLAEIAALKRRQNEAAAELTKLRQRLMAEPPTDASVPRLISHYAGLVGEAMVGIDAAIQKLS